MASSSLWLRFQQYFLFYRDLDLSLDISRLKFPEDFFEKKQVSEKLVVGDGKTAEEIARSIDAHPEDLFHVLLHLASNDQHIRVAPGEEPSEDRFSVEQER
jgi:hypothetical protein